jgi:archaellum component FlaF (FlaF/FlaG flagellin family)
MFKPKLLVYTLLISAFSFSCGNKTADVATDKEKSSKRGAYTMPYVRYDSNVAEIGGAARQETAFDFDYKKTASEAANQEYISLQTTDDFISWTVNTKANGVTVRFTLPDNKSGESVGQKSEIDFLVNGNVVKTYTLDSRWAWQYFEPAVSDPKVDITDFPKMRFDEVHFLLSDYINPGDVVSIRKTNNDGLETGIDFIEIEDIPAPIAKPGDALSVIDFGAKADGVTDDWQAVKACIKEALASNKIVYFPEGTYVIDTLFVLFEDGINIQGAGMWYTDLYFSNNNIMKAAICGNASNLRLADLHINGVNVLRQERDGSYRDQKGIWGNWGENSVIENVWVEHFECGLWTAGYAHTPPVKSPTNGLRVTNVRLRNHYADGVNFAEGTSNSIFEYSDIRNCGDDGIASWSQQADPERNCNKGNTFRYNTVEFGWRAGGIGIFGGGGHKIHNCYIGEHILSAGIRFTADFPGCALDTDTNHAMKVWDCTIYKCGTTKDLFFDRLGSIDIHGGPKYPLQNISFENIDIIDSQSDGIQLWGGNMDNITFKDVTFNGIGKGKTYENPVESYDIAVRKDTVERRMLLVQTGSANFINVSSKSVFSELGKGFVLNFANE